jgi:DNA polymerase III delta prime subunit
VKNWSEYGQSVLFVGSSSNIINQIAASYVCQTGGCGTCSDCQQALQGTHIDVHLYQPSDTGYAIADIRSIVQSIYTRPQIGRTNFSAITQAETLSEESQDTLLKALEEPPTDSALVLFTSKTSNLLPTVLSRVVEVRLHETPVTTESQSAKFLIDQLQTSQSLYQILKTTERYLSLIKEFDTSISSDFDLLADHLDRLLHQSAVSADKNRSSQIVDALHQVDRAKAAILQNIPEKLVLENLLINLIAVPL